MNLKQIGLVGAAILGLGFLVPAVAQNGASPLQWNYAWESPSVAQATYPGDVVINGNCTFLNGSDPTPCGGGSDLLQVTESDGVTRAQPKTANDQLFLTTTMGYAQLRLMDGGEVDLTGGSTGNTNIIQMTQGGQLNFLTTGYVTITNLPTSDPHVVNELWNNSGVLTISSG
jgi:hypothetical protein